MEVRIEKGCNIKEKYPGFCSEVCKVGCLALSAPGLAEGLKKQRRIDARDPQTMLPIWNSPSTLEEIGDFISNLLITPEENISDENIPDENIPARMRPDSLFVLALDLKGLKSINDTLGMYEGDKHIVQAAAALKFRKDDLVFRRQQGGDEFIVLMPWVQEGTNDISLEPFLNRCGVSIVQDDFASEEKMVSDGSIKYFSGNAGLLVKLDRQNKTEIIKIFGDNVFNKIKEFKGEVCFTVRYTPEASGLEPPSSRDNGIERGIFNRTISDRIGRIGLRELGLVRRRRTPEDTKSPLIA